MLKATRYTLDAAPDSLPPPIGWEVDGLEGFLSPDEYEAACLVAGVPPNDLEWAYGVLLGPWGEHGAGAIALAAGFQPGRAFYVVDGDLGTLWEGEHTLRLTTSDGHALQQAGPRPPEAAALPHTVHFSPSGPVRAFEGDGRPRAFHSLSAFAEAYAVPLPAVFRWAHAAAQASVAPGVPLG